VVLDAVGLVRPEGHLLPDHLHSLPRQVKDAVAQGIRWGATNALASAQVRSGWDLGQLEPGFPTETDPKERRALISMFAGAAAVIAAEIDVDDVLTTSRGPLWLT
jgi:hypothetical protein